MRSILLLLLVSVFSGQAFAQDPAWRNYVNGQTISDILTDSTSVWVAALGGGLVRIDKQTGQKTFYQNDNSNIPTNFPTTLAKDLQGNLWIGFFGGVSSYGPLGGIARFDGNNWLHYDTTNSGLPHNHVRDILITASGALWVATSGGGAAKFESGIWQSFTPQNSALPHTWVHALEEDSQGNIYFATGAGLAVFDGANWQIHNYATAGFPSESITDLEWDLDGRLLVASGSGLYVLENSSWTFLTDSQTPALALGAHVVATDPSNNYWLGTPLGVVKYNGTTWTHYSETNTPMETSDIYCITFDKLENKVYASCAGQRSAPNLPYYWADTALVSFDGASWEKINTSRFKVQPVNWILSDAEGENIWIWDRKWYHKIISPDSVISKLIPDTIQTIGIHYGNATRSVDRDGNIWGGGRTDNIQDPFDPLSSLIYKFNPVTDSLTLYNPPVSSMPGNYAAYYFHADRRGNLWLTGGSGLMKFDGTTWQSIFLNVSYRTLKEDSQGRMYFVYFPTSAIMRADTLGNVGVVPLSPNLMGSVLCAAIDSQDRYWFAQSHTINSFDPASGQVQNFSFPAGTGWPEDMVVDDSGNVWVALPGSLTGGLYRFDGTTWTWYNSYNSGLADNFVKGLIMDSSGNLIITSEGGGVSVFDPNYVVNSASAPLAMAGFTFDLYPNPAHNYTTVSYTLIESAKAELQVLDVTGKVVNSQTHQGVAGQNTLMLPTAALANGCYFYRLSTPQTTATKKLIISH